MKIHQVADRRSLRYTISGIAFILACFITSCNEGKVITQDQLRHTIDSLIQKNKEKDSIIVLIINDFNEVRLIRSSETKSSNTLYGEIKPESIDNYEFAKLLNVFDTSISYWNDEFHTTILKSCNGPSDPELEYCNCSDNIYITTGNEMIPEEYYLFKIGPFMELQLDSLDTKKMELVFHHQMKGIIKHERVKINLTNVKKVRK